ncbi:MAG: DUF3352 domain-containing protein [Anaerolineae bacterium]|nr:DUF3352 domain-containing protein [Anaerolineae bacterium]NUQ04843.1 DUF3352 domain-containing protein [Anaerolineae bacterium]
MKRFWLNLALVLLTLLPSLALAQDERPALTDLARVMRADTFLYVAMRTDEEFLALLESLTQPLVDLANAGGQPTPSLRDSLNQGLASANTDLDSVMAWLGDTAALGMTASAVMPDVPPGADGGAVILAAQIDDRAAAEAFFVLALPDTSPPVRQGSMTVYELDGAPSGMAITDDLIVVYTSTPNPLLTRDAKLDSSPAFQNAVDALPADAYNVLVYADPRWATSAEPIEAFAQPLETAPLAVGFTVLDDRSFVIDSAQLPLDGAAVSAPAVIDPAFAQYFPANASATIQAANLSGLIQAALALFDAAASDSQAPAPSMQARQVFAFLGLDLEADLLSWTTGDFGLFLRTNFLDLAPNLIRGGVPNLSALSERIDAGLVIEATDPAKAQALAAKLGEVLTQMTANQQGVSLSSETAYGVETTVIHLDLPLDATTTIPLDLLLGASDAIFFLGTRPAVEAILSGDGTLPANPLYNAALTHALPDPTTLWYADGEGLMSVVGTVTVVELALLGPAVGAVFDNIVAELQAEGGVAATPTPTPTPAIGVLLPPELTEAVEQAVSALQRSTGTISATVNGEGVTLLRFVITLPE